MLELTLLITRADSFLWAAEFRAKLQNLAVSAEFLVSTEFYGIVCSVFLNLCCCCNCDKQSFHRELHGPFEFSDSYLSTNIIYQLSVINLSLSYVLAYFGPFYRNFVEDR